MNSIVYAVILVLGLKFVQSHITIQEETQVYVAQTTYLERMERMGIQCPEVVTAQMVHETGFFTSDIYKRGHNLFGMKKAYYRSRDLQLGEYKGHASYQSDAHSLLDYKEWQDYVGGKWLKRRNKEKFSSNEEYMQFLLDVGYAEDRRYINKLKKYINLINNN